MKMDAKLVAAKEKHESEVKYIASKFKCPIGVIRTTMLEQGRDGKPARSRRVIYAALKAKGFERVLTKKQKQKAEDTEQLKNI